MKKLFALALGAMLSFPAFAASPAVIDNPATDLIVEAKLTKGFLMREGLRGVIFNRSNIEYDDVKLKVVFYDESNNHIGMHTLTINEDIEPGEAEDLKLKFDVPNNADRAVWTVLDAEKGGL